MYDFANILFAGPCNRACPFCIGLLMPHRVDVDTLGVFPPRGIEGFIEMVNRHEVREIWNLLEGVPRVGSFHGNPVHDLDGMEVTCWSFDATDMRSLNLFADGTLGTSYLITRTPELGAPQSGTR